jgi:hypothetical protein
VPNHSTNYLVVYGPPADVQAVFAAHFPQTADGFHALDFETVAPTPPELADTVSPTDVVATQAEADQANAEWKASGQSMRAITRDEAERRRAAHGAVNWYEFHARHWGTKWNAYHARADAGVSAPDGVGLATIQAVFDTAWTAPTAIFEALVKRHPNVQVAAITVHEGGEEPTIFGDPHEHMAVRTVVEFY